MLGRPSIISSGVERGGFERNREDIWETQFEK